MDLRSGCFALALLAADPVAVADAKLSAAHDDAPAQNIALPATPDQSVVVSAEHYPGVLEIDLLSVCSDGESALVMLSEPALDVWPAVLGIWPEIAEAMLVIAGLLLLRRSRRVRRGERGVPHCRRCGYLIYGRPSRCSECGTQLTASEIQLGAPGRMTRIAAVGVGVLALVAFPVCRSRLPRNWNWVNEHCRWYSRGLLHGSESLLQISAIRFTAFPASVVEFDLETQMARRTIYTADLSVEDVRTWQEGETCLTAFVADMDRVVVIREASGQRPRVQYCASEATYPELIGFSADGEHLYYYDTSHQIESVCAIELSTGRVDRVRHIPCNLWSCFGPTGPYFELNPSQRSAVVYDEAARKRGEPTVRILDLDSGEWIATLPTRDERSIWGANWVPSEVGLLLRVNDTHEEGSDGRSGVTIGSYSLNDAAFSREVFIPTDRDEEDVLDVQVLSPHRWRIVTMYWLDETRAAVGVRQVDFASDGTIAISTCEQLISQPAECDPMDWYSVELQLAGGQIEWELQRYDELGSALLLFDLELPPPD